MIKGKRNKGRFISDYGAKELFTYYKKTTDSKIAVNNKVFYEIIKGLNEGLMDAIILKSEAFNLPCRLGILRIKKSITQNNTNKKKLKVDWGNSLKFDKIIYHLNENRKGHYYRFYWRKTNGALKCSNATVYSFIPLRVRKQQLADILKNNKDIDYLN